MPHSGTVVISVHWAAGPRGNDSGIRGGNDNSSFWLRSRDWLRNKWEGRLRGLVSNSDPKTFSETAGTLSECGSRLDLVWVSCCRGTGPQSKVGGRLDGWQDHLNSVHRRMTSSGASPSIEEEVLWQGKSQRNEELLGGIKLWSGSLCVNRRVGWRAAFMVSSWLRNRIKKMPAGCMCMFLVRWHAHRTWSRFSKCWPRCTEHGINYTNSNLLQV